VRKVIVMEWMSLDGVVQAPGAPDEDTRDPLEWQNSTVLQGAVPDAVRALKEEDGAYLLVMGSTQLVETPLEHDVVDELRN
jgi:dihydrofolate reductase